MLYIFRQKRIATYLGIFLLTAFMLGNFANLANAANVGGGTTGAAGTLGSTAGTAAVPGGGKAAKFTAGAATVLKGAAGVAGTIITFQIIAYIVQRFAAVILTIAASALDMAFYWNKINIFTDSVSSPPILIFWGYSRDLANSFLILILLWIAFGIIFNLERINARKLLVRVILIGLTINFSLTLTSTIFAFSNALAQPFAQRLAQANGKEQGIAAKIMEITNLHTAMNASGENTAAFKKEMERQAAQPKSGQETTPASGTGTADPKGGGFPLGPDSQTYAFNTVPQQSSSDEESSFAEPNTAKAVVPVVFAAAGIAVLKMIGWALGAELIGEFMQKFALGGASEGAIGSFTNQGLAIILNPIIGSIFLLVGAFIMGSLALVFIARGLVIMLLAVLSPLVFLAAVIPGQDNYWKMWMRKLINWSFFAPISFFLLLFAFYFGDVLQGNTNIDIRGSEIQANLPAMFQYFIIMGLIISALLVAKYMGIKFAGTMLNFGEKFAMKGVKGIGNLGWGKFKKSMLPTLGRVSQEAETAIGKAPVGWQRALSLPALGLRKITHAGRGEALKAQKQYEGDTDIELQRSVVQGSLTAADRTGKILELAKRKKLAPMPGMENFADEIRKASRGAVDQLRNVGGDFMKILKANPTLAHEKDFSSAQINDQFPDIDKLGITGLTDPEKRKVAAQIIVWKKIDADEWKNADSKGVFDNLAPLSGGSRATTANGALTQKDLSNLLFTQYSNSGDWGALGRDLPDLVKQMNEFLATAVGLEQIKKMDPGTYSYFSTPTARAAGFILPPGHIEPNSVLIENMKRLSDRIDKLSRNYEKLGGIPGIPRARLERAHSRITEALAEFQTYHTRATSPNINIAPNEIPPIPTIPQGPPPPANPRTPPPPTPPPAGPATPPAPPPPPAPPTTPPTTPP